LHVQGDVGHPGQQGGGPEKNNRKKRRAKEAESQKWSQTQKITVLPSLWSENVLPVVLNCQATIPTRGKQICMTAGRSLSS
jgi:hypothetical protein